ncbi:putative DNA-binding protein [Methanophagales archaeon]|jgi:predicted DNA-binding antitoxin AbrB/MazE fold protein|nr:putative DNA-binding protein [Methanophagales archaeon]
MQKTIEVVYEKGMFKPLEKVDLQEGERIKIEIRDFKRKLDAVFGILKAS